MNGQIISFHASFKHFHFSQKRLIFPKNVPKNELFSQKRFPKTYFWGFAIFTHTIKHRFYAICGHFEVSEFFPKTSFKKTICYGTIALILKKAFSLFPYFLKKTYNKIPILLYFYLTIVGFIYILGIQKDLKIFISRSYSYFYSGYTF